ncbi:MAG: Clp protease N-terminal domain-containing protein, partial [Desulfobacterales bacterium]
HHSQQIEREHLFGAMLGEQEGITRTLLRKLGVSPDDVAQKLSITIDKFPKISREILLMSCTLRMIENFLATITNFV